MNDLIPENAQPASLTQQRSLIRVARGLEPADLVLRNGRVVNVFTNEIQDADIAIYQDRIAGLGPRGAYTGKEEVDLKGNYVTPGLIEAHLHIEDTFLTPAEFARTLVPHGTTTCVSDPHEIANVAGLEGLRWILEASENVPLRLFFTLPSCVPASPYENAGAVLKASDFASLISNPRIASVGEMMNYPGVLAGDQTMLEMIALGNSQQRPIPVDGHAPELGGLDLCAYVAAGIQSDHESTSAEEALAKVRLGMWLWVREGSTHNLDALLPVILEHLPERSGFVVDDSTPGDLLNEGDLDHIIRLAVSKGLAPIQAIKMASIYPAQYFGFRDRGAIAPGYLADLLVVPDLNIFLPKQVYIGGKLMASEGKPLFEVPLLPAGWSETIEKTIVLKDFSQKHFSIPGKSGQTKVIGIVPDQILTESLSFHLDAINDCLVTDRERDILKVAVVERYGRGNVGVGFLHGLGLKRGAIASSVAHDAHNIIVVGVNDEDMAVAVKEIERLQGGLVIAADGKVLDVLALPIGGIISPLAAAEVAQILDRLEELLAVLGVKIEHPFGFLSFLALSVVPSLKITDLGLLDVEAWKIVPLQEP